MVLGGKGAGLAEMVALGLPVPPGFVVTTTVSRAQMHAGRFPKRLDWHLRRGVALLEQQTGEQFGNTGKPLMLSVRSGAPISMPGMMDTILNLGLNKETVRALEVQGGSEFAADCNHRFDTTFGKTVGRTENVWEQLELAIMAVCLSWDSERAIAYRKAHGISETLGTAVTVQRMVFGNKGQTSCTGVVFSRDVRSGQPGLFGEFLVNAQGEDLVSGSKTPRPISEMKAWNAEVYAELDTLVRKLEGHYEEVVDVEFTVEDGKLYLLQVRSAKLTAVAAATVAVHGQWEKMWSKEVALGRVSKEQLSSLTSPAALDVTNCSEAIIAQGLAASPGAAVGKVVLSSAKAQEMAKAGQSVVLVRPDTNPDDLPGMLVAKAVVTFNGGTTCHAAIVARGIGIPAVVGCTNIELQEGQVVSVDGTNGVVYAGEVPLTGGTSTKEVSIFLKWAKAAGLLSEFDPARININLINESFSMNRVLVDFYLSDDMAKRARGTELEIEARQLRRRIHQKSAEIMACYLFLAVAAELRHAWESGSKNVQRSEDQLKQLEMMGYSKLVPSRREHAQRLAMEIAATKPMDDLIRFAKLAVEIFNDGSWQSGMGGSRWGAIAQALLGFLKGELNHTVFVDHAFDLQHNGGRLFDKHSMVTSETSEIVLQDQLNLKKKFSGGELFCRLQEVEAIYTSMGSRVSNTRSPEVSELWKKGTNKKLWGQTVPQGK